MSENNSSKLGLIKKALHIWIFQYHFVIPKEILKGYIHKYHTESDNISKYGQRFYDPSVIEEYNKWLSFQTYEKKESFNDLTFIGEDINDLDTLGYPKLSMRTLDLHAVKTAYVCITKNDCIFYRELLGYLSLCKEADITYFDHDINQDGKRSDPYCMPDYSYDTLRGFNCIGNVWTIQTSLLKQFEGQNWNPYRWLLELSDQAHTYKHVEKILYGEKEKIQCEQKSLLAYFEDHQIDAKTEIQADQVSVNVSYALEKEPLVSIIIPTKNGKDVLETCIDAILSKSTYLNYEIIIADNGSEEEETLQYFKELEKKENIHIVPVPGIFNFSYINNEAIKHSKGEYIVLLNNDTAVITEDWLEKMVSYAQKEHVGSVGIKMYYEDGTIQHAGVISGKGGGAAHRYYRKPHDTEGYLYTMKIAEDVACCTAACLMIPRKKYEELHGLNEELSVQFNDVDFGLRLLEKGYFNVFLPDVEMFHYESKSRGIDKEKKAVERYVYEVDYAQKKWAQYIEHDPFYNDNFDKNYDYMLIVGHGSN